jgi:hypothetical protein
MCLTRTGGPRDALFQQPHMVRLGVALRPNAGKSNLSLTALLTEPRGPLKALTREFPVRVKHGMLQLELAARGGDPVIRAITVNR